MSRGPRDRSSLFVTLSPHHFLLPRVPRLVERSWNARFHTLGTVEGEERVIESSPKSISIVLGDHVAMPVLTGVSLCALGANRLVGAVVGDAMPSKGHGA